jgi:hypothetical protein
MATASQFTFASYIFASQQAVNAHGPLTYVVRVRDRFGVLQVGKVGDYVLQDEDGALRIMPGARFEAEYAATSAVTAPSGVTKVSSTDAAASLSWTIGDAAAIPHITQDGADVAQNEANDNTATISGLTANTGYSFSVFNRKNETNSTSATPLVVYTLPLPIADAPVASAVLATSFTVTWVNADATAETEIHVDDGLGGAFSIFSTEAAGATSKNITGLTAERDYIVKLKHKGVVSDLVSATFSPDLEQSTPAA